MPVVAGQKSKFACLKIDDDSESSDDDSKKATTSSKNPSKSASHKNGERVSGNNAAPLIVHTIVPKPKLKGKKAKKAQKENSDQLEPSGAARVCYAFDPDEMKFQEDIKEAMALSAREAMKNDNSNAPDDGHGELVGDKKECDSPEVERLDTMANELTKNGFNKEVTRKVVDLYRSELIRSLSTIENQTVEMSRAASNVAKYKERYKKLCELLAEAEVYEKALLLTQLERSKALEKELGEQVGTLRGELMRASTRINELEEKLKCYGKH